MSLSLGLWTALDPKETVKCQRPRERVGSKLPDFLYSLSIKLDVICITSDCCQSGRFFYWPLESRQARRLKSRKVFLSFFSSSIKVQLIYNVALVSGIQQSDSVMHTYMSISDSFPL